MKKNSIAARICAAALACGIAATPALALAQTCVQPADTATSHRMRTMTVR